MKIAEKRRTSLRQISSSISLQADPIQIHTGPLEGAEEPIIDRFQAVMGEQPQGEVRRSLSIADNLDVSNQRKWRRMSGTKKRGILRRAEGRRNLQEALERVKAQRSARQAQDTTRGQEQPQKGNQADAASGRASTRQTMQKQASIASRATGAAGAVKAPRTAKAVVRKSTRLIRRSAGGSAKRTMADAENKQANEAIMKRSAAIGLKIEGSILKTLISNPPLGIAIIVLLLIVIISTSKNAGGAYYGSGGDGYIAEAVRIAEDNSIGYDMYTRRCLNPDVDCSSLVYYALVNGGYPQLKEIRPGPFNTTQMGADLKELGFQELSYSRDALLAGDIMVRPYAGASGHTEIYIGDGKTVGAHGDYDGRPGDSSGVEVSVGPHDGSYTNIYRPPNVPKSGTFSGTVTTSHTETAFAALVQGGLSEAAAAGIIGNMFAETAYGGEDLNPNIVEGTGEGVGLVQWSFGSKTAFLAYAKAKNDPWPNTSVQTQIEFLLKQLDEGKWGWSSYTARHYPAKDNITYEEFKTLTDPEFAAEVFCAKFEVPNFELAHLEYRRKKAREIYEKYAGNNYSSGINYGVDFSEFLGGGSPLRDLAKAFSIGG